MSFMNLLEGLIYFFVFCPNVQIIAFGTDTQPYALGCFLLLLLVYVFKSGKLKMPPSCVWFLVVGAAAVGLFIIGAIRFSVWEATRSFLNYVTIIIVPIGAFYLFHACGGIKERYVKIMINLWLVVALIQKYIYAEFMYFCIAGHRTTAERGVISLMSEPSFYGYMCIFAMFFVMEFQSKKERNIYLINLLIQIVLLAQSSITIFYLGIIIGIYVMSWFCRSRVSMKAIILLGVFLLLAVVGLVIFISLYEEQESRLADLLYMAITSPGKLLTDKSIRERFGGIEMALVGTLQAYFMPHGFGAGRIMSGYGAALYECGFFAVAIIMAFYNILHNQETGASKYHLEVSFSIIMFSAIQLSLPILSFVLGYCLYKKKDNRRVQFKWGGGRGRKNFDKLEYIRG